LPPVLLINAYEERWRDRPFEALATFSLGNSGAKSDSEFSSEKDKCRIIDVSIH
jgi:hypothetical protein